jgi:hypothetical protein
MLCIKIKGYDKINNILKKANIGVVNCSRVVDCSDFLFGRQKNKLVALNLNEVNSW